MPWLSPETKAGSAVNAGHPPGVVTQGGDQQQRAGLAEVFRADDRDVRAGAPSCAGAVSPSPAATEHCVV
jgi:hypothetical protein